MERDTGRSAGLRFRRWAAMQKPRRPSTGERPAPRRQPWHVAQRSPSMEPRPPRSGGLAVAGGGGYGWWWRWRLWWRRRKAAAVVMVVAARWLADGRGGGGGYGGGRNSYWIRRGRLRPARFTLQGPSGPLLFVRPVRSLLARAPANRRSRSNIGHPGAAASPRRPSARDDGIAGAGSQHAQKAGRKVFRDNRNAWRIAVATRVRACRSWAHTVTTRTRRPRRSPWRSAIMRSPRPCSNRRHAGKSGGCHLTAGHADQGMLPRACIGRMNGWCRPG